MALIEDAGGRAACRATWDTGSMPTRISPETAALCAAAWPSLLADIESGANIAKAIETRGLKREWLRAYKRDPELQREWDDAREHSADAFVDEGLDIARNPIKIIAVGEPGNETGTAPLIIRIDPAAARVHVDYLKWIAAKRNQKYNDKATLDVNVRTVDLTRIIQDANARLAAQRAAPLELKPGADGIYQLPAELAALM